MTKCYELIEIRIKNEDVFARPVAWDREIYDGFGNDKSGNPVNPTEFQATCPHCGNLVHFASKDIYKDDKNKSNVKCFICGAGIQNVKGVEETQQKPETKEVTPQKEVFIDPIATGLFNLEVNYELLEKLDSTKAD